MTTPDQTADRTQDVSDVLLDDVWDAATNAVCQTMQESRMCNCPDGQCLAATVRPERADYARLAEEIETLRREHDRQKRRGDGHWETLRSIREIAREGDCARIIQWVNDAGSGYVKSAEVTLKEMTDRVSSAEASLTTAQKENVRLREALGRIASNGFGHRLRNLHPVRDKEMLGMMKYAEDTLSALSADKPTGGRESVAVEWRAGFDETEFEADLPTYGISRYENGKEVHGNQINVYGDLKLRDRLLAFLNSTETLAAAPVGGEPVAVQIKPLEWEWRKEGFWRAATACDWGYRVYRKDNGWEFNNGYFDAPEAAKAAAQADYEQRIRSALITPSAPTPHLGVNLGDKKNEAE